MKNIVVILFVLAGISVNAQNFYLNFNGGFGTVTPSVTKNDFVFTSTSDAYGDQVLEAKTGLDNKSHYLFGAGIETVLKKNFLIGLGFNHSVAKISFSDPITYQSTRLRYQPEIMATRSANFIHLSVGKYFALSRGFQPYIKLLVGPEMATASSDSQTVAEKDITNTPTGLNYNFYHETDFNSISVKAVPAVGFRLRLGKNSFWHLGAEYHLMGDEAFMGNYDFKLGNSTFYSSEYKASTNGLMFTTTLQFGLFKIKPKKQAPTPEPQMAKPAPQKEIVVVRDTVVKQVVKRDTVVREVVKEVVKQVAQVTTISFSGNITDAETGEPISASISVLDLTTNETIETIYTTDGSYTTSPFAVGTKYAITAYHDGYLDVGENYNALNTKNTTEIRLNFKLPKIKAGATVKLNNIFFEHGKATLTPESYGELDRLVEFLTTNPTIKVEISGHTDNTGTVAVNNKLSNDRANAVSTYLIRKGIANSRLVSVGYGSGKPIEANTTEAGRQANRRVEFKILSVD